MAETGNNTSFFTLLKEQVSHADIGNTAVLIAYYILLSLFPLAIALGNVLPLFHIDPADIMPYLDALVPEAVQPILSPIVEQLLTTGNGGLFSLSMLGVLWGASRGFGQLERGLALAYDVTDKRNDILKMILSVLAVVFVLLLIVALALVFGLGNVLLEELTYAIPEAGQIGIFITDLGWPVTFVLLLCILVFFYMRAPSVKVRMRDALPGALFSVIGWMILAVTFTLYLKLIANSLSTYGVLSTFFVLMFWLNFASIILLFGAVLNATIYRYRHGEFEAREYPLSQKLKRGYKAILKKTKLSKKKK